MKNHRKIDQKSTKNQSKMDQTSIKNRGLEGSGAGLEASWAVLGDPKRLRMHRGPSWRRLGGVLEGSWRPLGLSWERLGGVLGASWAVLERRRGILEASWSVLRTSWAVFGAILLV